MKFSPYNTDSKTRRITETRKNRYWEKGEKKEYARNILASLRPFTFQILFVWTRKQHSHVIGGKDVTYKSAGKSLSQRCRAVRPTFHHLDTTRHDKLCCLSVSCRDATRRVEFVSRHAQRHFLLRRIQMSVRLLSLWTSSITSFDEKRSVTISNILLKPN